MTTTLLQRAHDLPIWTGHDDAYGPGCQTVERMNELRQLLIDVCATLEHLDHE